MAEERFYRFCPPACGEDEISREIRRPPRNARESLLLISSDPRGSVALYCVEGERERNARLDNNAP